MATAAMKGEAMRNKTSVANTLLWAFIALYLLMGAARLLHNADLQRLTPFMSVAILMGFALVHGTRRYGWRHFLVFFMLTFVISWSYETSSILTGFPFGHYVYTDKLGPKLWLVPMLIMPAYFSMGYIAWTLGHVLLDRFDDRLAGAEVVLVPMLASFVMVMWDLVIDPASSTITGAWIGAMAAAISACRWSTFSAGTFAFSRSTWCLHCICSAQSKERERQVLERQISASAPRGHCPRSCMAPSR